MEFRALGRVAVFRDGEEVDLGPPRQKAVLALLLAYPNAVMSADRIIEELWRDDSEGKLNAVRVYVSRLRSALEPERPRGVASVLETVSPGYRLNVPPEDFDVSRFEIGAAEGRRLLATDPPAAARILASALGLWKGPAFEDFAYDEFAQLERERLDGARVDALEDRIEADLACGLAGELVSELEVLRDQHPLRERLVAHHALALYRSGRPADSLREIDRFRRHLGDELGIDPSPPLLRLEEQILLHDERIQPRAPTVYALTAKRTRATNPFKGLRPFEVDDADSFFGRDALVADLLRVLGRGQRLVALVGASGSGKSSVVRAGLIPALAKGAVENSDGWLVASMMPGAHPFAELEAALLRSTLDAPDSLSDQLQDGDTGLLRATLRILGTERSHLVLIIDQLEELFTLVDRKDVRDRFLDNLVTAVDDPYGRITVVVTLRADFYGHQLTHPEFGARLGAGVVNVTPMVAEELEVAAVRPAAEAGVSFEPALLGQLIADVGGQPGSLPLFQFALTELFDRRETDTLTAAAYRSMGGLEGALQRRASDLFERLEPREQEAARQLFLRLVVVSDDGEPSRRRVPAREILSLAADPVTMQHVIGTFGEHRLLTFDSDRLTGSPTVEVSHEALLAAWPMLVGWLNDSRADLRRHASLTMSLREWQLAGEDSDYLLSGARLAELLEWLKTSSLALNREEREFLAFSSARIDEIQAEADRRHRHEVRRRRRLWALVAALGVSLGVTTLYLAGILGGGGPTITFFGNRSDNGWNANIGAGLDRAARELGLTIVDVEWVVEPGLEFRELAASGPDIVISDGLGPGRDPTVMSDFPDTRFGIIDSAIGGTNSTSVVFANEDGGYLAGVAAALKSESGVIGFVGGQQIREIEEFRAGFEAGAGAVDPDVIILATFVDQFYEMPDAGFASPDVGADRAAALYRRGADVVFAAAGYSGIGMFDAVEQESKDSGRHLWAIGVDNDQWYDVAPSQRPYVLTSVIKRGDVAAYRLVEHMLEDGTTGPFLRLGLAEDGFTYSDTGDGLTPDLIAGLDRAIDDVRTGRVRVPAAPRGPTLLLDPDGNDLDGP